MLRLFVKCLLLTACESLYLSAAYTSINQFQSFLLRDFEDLEKCLNISAFRPFSTTNVFDKKETVFPTNNLKLPSETRD
jgi:hypothetical protein